MRLTLMPSAALIAMTVAAFPGTTLAGGLIDADVTVGGGSLASVGVNANLGGINADVNAGAGGATGLTAAVGTTTGTKLTTSPVSRQAVSARADVAGVIHAKAQLLSPKQLAKLCVTVGANGCGGASRAKQLSLIDARVKVLSARQLANVCVSVGGSCGAAPASTGGGGSGGGGSGTPAGSGSDVATGVGAMSLASADGGNGDRDMRITCHSVLASPARYEAGLVKLCRKIGQ